MAKVLELQFQHQSFQRISRAHFFGIYRFDLLAVQGTQEFSPTTQFKGIGSLVLSFLYDLTFKSVMTTGKTIALIIWIFVGKVMPLLFNMLYRFVIAFFQGARAF